MVQFREEGMNTEPLRGNRPGGSLLLLLAASHYHLSHFPPTRDIELKITDELIEHLKKQARADVFRAMAQPGAQEKALEQLAAQSDEMLNSVGRLANIPEEQLPVFRAQFRGTDNEFTAGLLAFAGKLQPGDIVLMTGTSLTSRALAASQKAVYPWAKSSHVGLMHAELVCIDAIPGVGVSNRLLTEVLHGTADDWRVIRFNDVDKNSMKPSSNAALITFNSLTK